jgi:hypothetical protein
MKKPASASFFMGNEKLTCRSRLAGDGGASINIDVV